MFASVIVAVLARVENSREGPQGGVGDLGVDGGLAAGLVPQDLDVEGLQQPRLQLRREAGQDVPGEGPRPARCTWRSRTTWPGIA